MWKPCLAALGTYLATAGLVLGQTKAPTPQTAEPPEIGPTLPAPETKTPPPVPEDWRENPLANVGREPVSSWPRMWGGAEYLLWRIQGSPTPPLVTTGDPTAKPAPGALGAPGTVVLFGGSPIDYGNFSGFRLTLGGWIDANQTWGLEGNGFALLQRSVNFSAASGPNGYPALYVPFYNTNPKEGPPHEGSFTIADPKFAPYAPTTGSIGVATSASLFGAEINGLYRLGTGAGFDLFLLGGFRYLNLQESLGMTGNVAFNNPVQGNTYFQYQDSFSTSNQFYGGQLGARGEYHLNRWTAGLTGLVALGATHQVVNISGQGTVGGPGAGLFVPAPGTYPGGVLTQPSNIGQQSRNEFTVVPAIQFKIGCDLTQRVRATVGYDFLFWNSVVRPGNQIDRNVNSSQSPFGGNVLVGPANPAPLFSRSDFYAQGLSFGLEFRY